MSNDSFRVKKGIINLKPLAGFPSNPELGDIIVLESDGLMYKWDGAEWDTYIDLDSPQTLENKTLDATDATGTNTITIDSTDALYDNATSGLAATDAQGAIDEVEARVEQNETDIADHIANPAGAHAATAISYDNATSGLTATETQAAIDEVEARVEQNETDISTNATDISDHIADAVDAHEATAVGYDNTTSGLTAIEVQDAIDEIVASGATTSANRTLSNLESPTSINQNLIPDGNLTRSLGTGAANWDTVFADNLGDPSSTHFDAGSGVLKDGATDLIDLVTKEVKDTSANVSIDWENRTLNDAAGTASLTWDDADAIELSKSLGLAQLASDPVTTVEGYIYYSTTDDVVRVYADGTWKDLGSDGAVTLDTTQTITGDKTFAGILAGAITEDNASTGVVTTLALPDTLGVQFTDGGLTQITGITTSTVSQLLILQNKQGASITIKNEGVFNNTTIITGTGADLILEDNASIWLIYDTSTLTWNVIGGSGAATGATTALDNLASTAINADIIPDADSTHDLGSSANKWAEVHADVLGIPNAVHLDAASGTINDDLDVLIDVSNKELKGSGNQVSVDWDARTLNDASGTVSLTWDDADAVELSKSLGLNQLASDPITTVEGYVYYNTTVDKIKVYANGDWVEVGEGSGAGGINYIEENDGSVLTNWITYADAAGSVPVDGTGGSPSVTRGQVSGGTALRDNTSFLLTKGASNLQGEGVAYDFTIDNADKAKVLRMSMDYLVNSGTFEFNEGTAADPSDVVVYVYDVTNAELIYPTAVSLDGSGKFITEFQTNADSTSYRLILHVATTNAAAWQLMFDNVQVGPREIAKGYSPNKVEIKYLTADVTTTTADITDLKFTNLIIGKTYRVTLQSASVAVNGGTTSLRTVHDSNTVAYVVFDAGTTADDDGALRCGSSSIFTATTNTLITESPTLGAGSSILGNNSGVETFIQLEELNNYVGNATVVQSSDFGSRVIAGSFARNTTQSIPTSTETTVILNVENENTGGLDINTSTGVITVLESGYYYMSGSVRLDNIDDGDRIICSIDVNGTTASAFDAYSANENDAPSSSTSVAKHLVAGDEVELTVFHDNVAARNISADQNRVHLDIFKIQSPQTLLGGEVVAARYTSNAGQSFNSASVDIVNFEDKDYDTHNAVTIGASWKFTAPLSGYYSVSAKCRLNDFPEGSNRDIVNFIYVNGVDVSRAGNEWGGAATVSQTSQISDTIFLSAGDNLDVRLFQDSGSTVSNSTSSELITISIHKVN